MTKNTQTNYKKIAEEALITIKATKEQLKIILKSLDKHLKNLENDI